MPWLSPDQVGNLVTTGKAIRHHPGGLRVGFCSRRCLAHCRIELIMSLRCIDEEILFEIGVVKNSGYL
jgi:hypothetical protein